MGSAPGGADFVWSKNGDIRTEYMEQEEEPNSGDDLHLILIPSFKSDLMYFKVYHFIFPDDFCVK